MLKIIDTIKNFFKMHSNKQKLLPEGSNRFKFERIDTVENNSEDKERLKQLYVGIGKNEVDLSSQSLKDLNRILALLKLDELKKERSK